MAKQQSQELVAVSEEHMQLVQNIDGFAAKCSIQAIGGLDSFVRLAKFNAGANALSNALTDDLMAVLMGSRGMNIGYKTDKDYSVAETRRAFVEGMLQGAIPANGEMMIIGGNAYLQRPAFERFCRTLPGKAGLPIENLAVIEGLPVFAGQRATVKMTATWSLGAEKRLFEKVFPCRVNSGQGDDAILGKARRKLYKAIWELHSGLGGLYPDAADGLPSRVTQVKPQLAASGNAGLLETIDAQAPKEDQRPTDKPADYLVCDEVMIAFKGVDPEIFTTTRMVAESKHITAEDFLKDFHGMGGDNLALDAMIAAYKEMEG